MPRSVELDAVGAALGRVIVALAARLGFGTSHTSLKSLSQLQTLTPIGMCLRHTAYCLVAHYSMDDYVLVRKGIAETIGIAWVMRDQGRGSRSRVFAIAVGMGAVAELLRGRPRRRVR